MSHMENEVVHEGDIVFNCPYCGKSLAIAPEGAGLMVPCSECGKNVQVPIVNDPLPEGIPASGEMMELGETTTPEETIAQLDLALNLANQQIAQLLNEKETLLERRSYLENLKTEHSRQFDRMAEELASIQGAVDRLATHLEAARAGRPSS